MDERTGRSLRLMLKPHPIALILSALLYLAIYIDGRIPYGGSLALTYFLLLNLITKPNSSVIDLGQDIDDSFLSSFANNLAALGPEKAYVEALSSSPSPLLRGALAKMRDGIPICDAILCLKVTSKSEKTLLTTISRVLSYGSVEASIRLKRYLWYRQERRKIVTEYMGRMAVLSLRLKVLSAIAAASLAVIAFASPLLGSLSLGGTTDLQKTMGTDGIFPMMAFFSVSILSPFLYSRTVPHTNGSRISAACGILYVLVYLALYLTIGWRF
jgi:hypothetical protein